MDSKYNMGCSWVAVCVAAVLELLIRLNNFQWVMENLTF